MASNYDVMSPRMSLAVVRHAGRQPLASSLLITLSFPLDTHAAKRHRVPTISNRQARRHH